MAASPVGRACMGTGGDLHKAPSLTAGAQLLACLLLPSCPNFLLLPFPSNGLPVSVQFPLISKSQYFDENVPESAASGLTEMVIKVRRAALFSSPIMSLLHSRPLENIFATVPTPTLSCLHPLRRTFRARSLPSRSWQSTATASTSS